MGNIKVVLEIKRFWLGGLVLGVSAIALAGCGNKSDDQSASSDTNSSQVKGDIKLWVDTEHIAAIKGQVSKFEKANPDVKVKIKTGSSADALNLNNS